MEEDCVCPRLSWPWQFCTDHQETDGGIWQEQGQKTNFLLTTSPFTRATTSFPFSSAAGDIVEYTSRLFVTGASFALFIGLPVSWFGSVGAESEPLKRILCATSSGVFAVILAVVRMYLGWAYVGNRLLSATVECMLFVLCLHTQYKNCQFL